MVLIMLRNTRMLMIRARRKLHFKPQVSPRRRNRSVGGLLDGITRAGVEGQGSAPGYRGGCLLTH